MSLRVSQDDVVLSLILVVNLRRLNINTATEIQRISRVGHRGDHRPPEDNDFSSVLIQLQEVLEH